MSGKRSITIAGAISSIMMVYLTTQAVAADARVTDLVQARKFRLGLFLPQYTKGEKAGEPKGRGTGFLGIELAHAIAARLGIQTQIVEYATPADVVKCLKTNACDIAIMGIEPSRAEQVDFSPAVVQFDYTYLVPAGSSIQTPRDADRDGVRIAFVRHHASGLALARIVKHAKLVGADLPEAAFDLLRTGQADVFAFPRQELIDFALKLPGSRNLEEPYGVNLVGLAVPKGNEGRLGYVSEVVEEAKSSGTIQRIIAGGDQFGFRGFRVAPAGNGAK
jgi:polar amino acid transport system substrate-binding protein